MENSMTAAVPQQQQQQQPQMQKKKKSKNKKGNKPTPAEVGSALEADSAKKSEFNANGLSEQLAHELQINNSNNSSNSNNNNRNNINSTASSDKLRKTNKLANGTAKKELPAAHQINGHCYSVAVDLKIPAETKINGSPDADIQQQQQQQQAKKPKSKSNKQKHKESDKANNCHKICVNKEQSTQNETVETLPVLHDQEHVEKLKNGFCTATHKDEMKEESSFEQNTDKNINTDTQELEKNAQVEQQQRTQQQELKAAATPASTANTESETASKQQDAAVATEIVASPTLDLSNVQIEYKEYESELQMHDIMRLIQAELSEPYSIYTYRYFIYNWPKLCFLAAHGNEYVGAIVCKLDRHMNVKRGYIAMLAVRKEYRKLKIGTTLVQKAIEAMLADNADEVVLETEMRNLPALRLYENLGFVRDKRLFRYYLNGVDALRLKLWFR